MKKHGKIIFLFILVFIVSVGTSFAWYVWRSSVDTNVNVAFSSLDKYLDYRVVNIDESGNEVSSGGVATKIEYKKKDIAVKLEIYGNIYLNIDSVSDEKILQESGLTWNLYLNDESNLVSTGNFVGEGIGSKIPLAMNVKLDDSSVYILKIKQPSSGEQLNLDISGMTISTSVDSESIAPESFASGDGKINELYVRSVSYGAGSINKLDFYSSIYTITDYMITNTVDTPSASSSSWISITSNSSVFDGGFLASVSTSYTLGDVNNICVKNNNGDVSCKVVGKYNDVIDVGSLPDCVEKTYNGTEQQLVSSTGGTGYTLSKSEYNQTDAGDYNIVAKLNSGYEWSDGTVSDKTFTCTMNKKDITVTAGTSSKVYDGSTFTNNTCTSSGLVSGHAVICTMSSASAIVNVGSVDNVIETVTVKSGSEDVTSNYNIMTEPGTLTIVAKDITDDMITKVDPSSFIYDGSEKKPSVFVEYNGMTLGVNDYTLEYSNNINVGTDTAIVIVKGKGNYTGEVTKKFSITKADSSISLTSKSSVYTGSAVSANTAVVTGTAGNVTYTYYSDSSCLNKTTTDTGASASGAAPIDVGNYYVKAVALEDSNYNGVSSSCISHNITAKEIPVTWGNNVEFYYNGSKQAPTVTTPVDGVNGESVAITRTTWTDFGSHTSTASCDSVTNGRAKCSNYNLTNNTKDFTISYKKYTVTLNNQGATSAGTSYLYGRYADGVYLENNYVNKMSSSANKITVPTKTGYTFGGYYTAENGAGTQMIAATGYITSDFSNTLYDSDATLYAKWTINSYTVTYDYTTNGNAETTISISPSETTVNYGAAIDLTPTANKPGWTFVGWHTDSSKTEGLTSLTMQTSNVRLYAIFRKEAITLTASWDGNGATLSFTSQSSCTLNAVYNTASQATECTVDAPTITRSGYNIIGYNTSSSSTSNNDKYNISSGKLTLNSSNTGNTWHAITSTEATSRFYYYDSTATKYVEPSCTMYNRDTSCTINNVPTDVSSSTGPDGSSYSYVSDSVNSTSGISQYTSGKVYYAVYEGTLTANFTIHDNFKSITGLALSGEVTSTCKNYYLYNNGSYNSKGCSITNIPEIKANTDTTGYIALGWYDENLTKELLAIDATSASISSDIVYYANFRYVKAVELGYDNTETGLQDSSGNACTDVQCALDSLKGLVDERNGS